MACCYVKGKANHRQCLLKRTKLICLLSEAENIHHGTMACCNDMIYHTKAEEIIVSAKF